ncbi:MAG: alanine--tRNA ligase [Chthoniobacterales bacterium]
MTSAQIRQQFLDFFREKQHTIVPSSSLMPDSPNLLFTNAGMNQFVPIFLGQTQCPYTPGRAADTQKCIRAGGKHNDLDDVGLDTYHHTFFEMLGNWSFGDYFKKEAIEWAWELIVERWGFPANRVYATIYHPDKSLGDPAERDEEAYQFWAAKFIAAGLDPAIHIVNGNKKDNFWMMGETGPCGPCSELHIDLTPLGDTKGALVNTGDARCIEIWNLVFIQFNANPDGTFSPLPAQHVDTGMGFERVTSIIQGTKGFTDFANARISNYDTDIFRPIFDELEKMSGLRYTSTLPGGSEMAKTEQPDAPYSSASPQSPEPEGVYRPVRGQSPEKSWPYSSEYPSSVEPGGVFGTEYPPSEEKSVPYSHTSTANEQKTPENSQIAIDIAFRVIADHIRTLSFAIADGIQPGNNDRNYVLRRILRRAVRYGRTLGFKEPFFYKLVDVLALTMGDVFPEIRQKQKQVEETLKREEEAFNKTLDFGIKKFADHADTTIQIYDLQAECEIRATQAARELEAIETQLQADLKNVEPWNTPNARQTAWLGPRLAKASTMMVESLAAIPSMNIDESELTTSEVRLRELAKPIEFYFNQWQLRMHRPAYHRNEFQILEESLKGLAKVYSRIRLEPLRIRSSQAFELYDTYGFPLDLTELMARERGLSVDVAGFEKLMEEQRNRARAAQKKTVIELSEIETKTATHFLGYDHNHTGADVQEVLAVKGKTVVILNNSVCYAEMGGQVGDTGELTGAGGLWRIANTQKSGNTWLHFLEEADAPAVGDHITLELDRPRRATIQRHHSVTHLLHWALHEVVSQEATQKGSFVGPDKLTFDFNSAPLTPQQVREIERLVNEKIVENTPISWSEVPYAEVKGRADIMQFFGDKYGDTVRVVDIGGYSKELCAGTHARATGEIGLFRIVSEAAVAAGVRRIEAVAGLQAYETALTESERLRALGARLNSPLAEIEKKLDVLLAQQKELERALKTAQQREAAGRARELQANAETIAGVPTIIANLGAMDGDALQSVADALKSFGFAGVIVLGGESNGAVALVAAVSPEFTGKLAAGKIIQTIAPLVGGKGGGRPDAARGGGKDPSKLAEALAAARQMLTAA